MTEIELKQLETIKYYGPYLQLNQLIEECAELIVAIAKYHRHGERLSIIHSEKSENLKNLIGELADVKNLIQQFELNDPILGSSIEEVKLFKVDREIERISIKKQGDRL